ncbi:MAG: FHA domain-containing protein [Pseudomonadota bacterium]
MSSNMTRDILALLQATDRNGALAGRLDVQAWPITVGRALTADLVLDDSHVAAEHLRLERTEQGDISVTVLDTVNGVELAGRQHVRGSSFVWPAGQSLTIGRLKLGLRLAESALAAEERLPHFPWRAVAWTVLASAGVLAVSVVQAWLTLTEPLQLLRQLPTVLGMMVMGMAVWAGLWALATKLFTGRLQFWRHVRIACTSMLALQAVVTLASLLAFMFSLELLSRFELQLHLLGAAAAVYFHLTVITPQRRHLLASLVTGLAVLGISLMLGTTWLQNKRLSNTLYLSSFYPPAWRLAPAVPVKQFLDEAGSIRQRLDQRLKDSDSDDNANDGPDED